MTLAEIRSSDKAVLLVKDVAPILGCHEHAIRLAAKENDLPFPFFRSGNRVKIPRLPFLKWITGEEVKDSAEA